MKRFRAKTISALLFVLLSLGQAYPFAAAWANAHKGHPCCCATKVATPCGCDHSAKPKKFSCHSETRTAGISPAPCGARTEAPSLDFRGEDCLPRFASLVVTNVATLNLDDLSESLPKVSTVPDPPPPR